MANKYYKPAQSTVERKKALAEKKKRCGKCGVIKEHSEYYKDRTQYDGLANTCIPCKRRQQDEWRAANPERFKKSSDASRFRTRLKRYGLSEDDYKTMLSEQGGRCAICQSKLELFKHTHIDHCHETNTVRGLLCSNCNKGLGMFSDSVESLNAAIRYLRK